MGQPWENPNYGTKRRLRFILAALLLAVIAAAVFWTLRRCAPDKITAPKGENTQRRFLALKRFVPPKTADPAKAWQEIPGARAAESDLPNSDAGMQWNEARQAADALFSAGKFSEALEAYNRLALSDPFSRCRAGLCLIQLGRWSEAAVELQAAVSAQPNDFIARKWLALSLYRQNELEPALEQVRAALALQQEVELLELQAKLEREIQVQRHYDGARTADFTVLFDGYEHEEMKRAVLDILKSAHAEIGKELDHFPAEPVTVILYTAKDFSDVTRAPEWAGGMFGKLDGKIRVPVQGAASQERALRRVLYHEYTHALLYSLTPDCPLWLHEGLAQYFCGDRAVSVGQVIPLGLLVNGFPRDVRLAYVAYMESLQAVADLVDERGMPRLRRLLGELGNGRGLEAAFTAAYGEPFSRWAEKWRPVRREE
jgi:tetratricopeptide (TPR) repeat protein